MSDNEIYLLIKYVKSVLWGVAKRLSYIEDARCQQVKINFAIILPSTHMFHHKNLVCICPTLKSAILVFMNSISFQSETHLCEHHTYRHNSNIHTVTICILKTKFNFLNEIYIIEWNTQHGVTVFNLQAPRFLYIGQAFRYSPDNAFYIFNQQIYFII